MTVSQIRLIALGTCLLFWLLVGIGIAYAGVKHTAILLSCSSPIADCKPVPTSVIPAPITIKCPCDLHIQDGTLELGGTGQIAVGPKTTDYSGGHWSSDAPVSIDNHAPLAKKDDLR